MRSSQGAIEIQLLGQIVNHYQAPDDAHVRLRGAARAAERDRGPAADSVRQPAPAARHAAHDSRRCARLPKVCRHLHLPVQSGSTRVLGAMRRRHTREHYLELVASLRAAMPDIALSTDMIVGFPGETDADFDETLSLTAAVRYHSMFSFKYSPRPNTLAQKRLARRRERGGEDAADRGAADAAERHSGRAFQAGRRARGRRARRVPEPPAGLGVVGPDEREHGREFRRRPGVDQSARARSHHRGESEQPPWRSASGLTLGRQYRRTKEMGDDMQIEMTIKGLMVDPITNMPIIILRDKDGQRVLPIWVGVFEANAIALQMENVTTPRPMTHDLLKNVICRSQGRHPENRRLRPSREHVLRAHLPGGERRARRHRRPAERRDCAGAAGPGADLRRGPRHRPRQDGRLRPRQGELRAPAEVAREPRSGDDGPLQDVVGARFVPPPSLGGPCNFLQFSSTAVSFC